jgi:EpsI family protein
LHELSGWFVYASALGLLVGANFILGMIFKDRAERTKDFITRSEPGWNWPTVWPLLIALFVNGAIVQWFVHRGEVDAPRQSLANFPVQLGGGRQRGGEVKFGEQIESVLRTTDYTMREYSLPNGRIANIYVGYYASQRTGATYHSPQNCLPGAGWVMKDPQYIEIVSPAGRAFKAHRYIIENGMYKEVMIYWYQGRGRTEASEYQDKVNTVMDSVFKRRSDGAMVRVMTSIGSDENAADAAGADLAGQLVDELTPFIPE